MSAPSERQRVLASSFPLFPVPCSLFPVPCSLSVRRQGSTRLRAEGGLDRLADAEPIEAEQPKSGDRGVHGADAVAQIHSAAHALAPGDPRDGDVTLVVA